MKDSRENIVLIGMPGVGKTTIGKLLAQQLGREFVDIDEYLEQSVGMSIPEMFAISEEFFREQEARIIREIAAREQLVIATGGGVIKIPANIEALKQSGTIFFLNRSIEDIMLSLNAEYRPLLKDDPRTKLEQLYFERYDKYLACADYRIDCVCNEIQSTVEKITLIHASR
mgnify:CR=1 FL=1